MFPFPFFLPSSLSVGNPLKFVCVCLHSTLYTLSLPFASRSIHFSCYGLCTTKLAQEHDRDANPAFIFLFRSNTDQPLRLWMWKFAMETDHKRVYTVYKNRCFLHLKVINVVTKRDWEVISDNFQAGGWIYTQQALYTEIQSSTCSIMYDFQFVIKWNTCNWHLTAHCGFPRPNSHIICFLCLEICAVATTVGSYRIRRSTSIDLWTKGRDVHV